MTNEKGFTLIELLVVVAIIGVLAAIAIPQYAEYRVRSFNATAKSDMRNGILGEEAYATEDDQGSGAYVACADPGACEGDLPGFAATVDDQDAYVMDTYAFATADATVAGRTVTEGKFTAQSHHQNGSITWDYDSEDGQFVEN